MYVISDNLRMICSFTCMNYCHVTTILFFSFQLKEEKRKVKAFHLLHTWNKVETNLAIRISERSKEKKMWLNYKMPATELLMLNFSIANFSAYKRTRETETTFAMAILLLLKKHYILYNNIQHFVLVGQED